MDLEQGLYGLPRKLLLGDDSGAHSLSKGQEVGYAIAACLFVCGSGIASGLTLGLMSLDKLEMEVLLRSGSAKEQALARKILPVIADEHWLLVTLLLCNAGCFEALPIFLDALINPVGAILISVTLILLFGEILPQAVCARHGLVIGAAFAIPVQIFKWLTCPISWPLARMLDWLLGKETQVTFKRRELKTLIDLHGTDEGLGGKLSDDEVQIICGALDLTNKIGYSAMTPLDKVLMISSDAKIDRHLIKIILDSGHSRIPVYAGNRRTEVIGLLLVKELLQHAFPDIPTIGSEGEEMGSVQIPPPATIASLNLRPLPRLPASTPLYALLKLFQTGRSHMVLLTQPELEQEDADHNSVNNHHDDSAPTAGARSEVSKPVTIRAGLTAGAAIPPVHYGVQLANAAQIADDMASTSHNAEAGGHTSHNAEPGHTNGDSANARPGKSKGRKGLKGIVTDSGGASTYAQQESLHGHGSDSLAPPSPGILHLKRNSTASSPNQRDNDGDEHHPPESSRKSIGPIGRISTHLAALTHKRTRAASDQLSRSSSGSSSSSHSGSGSNEASEIMVEVPQLAMPGEPIGIITIEDVIEELMGQEILDETDKFADNTRTVEVNEETRAQMARALPDRIKNFLQFGDSSTRGALVRRLSRRSGNIMTSQAGDGGVGGGLTPAAVVGSTASPGAFAGPGALALSTRLQASAAHAAASSATMAGTGTGSHGSLAGLGSHGNLIAAAAAARAAPAAAPAALQGVATGSTTQQ